MATDKNRISWMIGGKAGEGIMTSGQQFAKAIKLSGLNVFTNTEYPSLIRGGHNTFAVRAEEKEVKAPIAIYNMIAAMNKETILENKDLITKNGAVIYDPEEINIDECNIRTDIKKYPIPMKKIIEEQKAPTVMKNSILLGASTAILNYDYEQLKKAIKSFNKKKGKPTKQEKLNEELAKKGYEYIKKNFPNNFEITIEKTEQKKEEQEEKIMINGNQAIALGAIKAGCKFMSAYPMTPATGIMQYYATHEKKKGLVMRQAFDEISAINMALGASYAGVRAMTATSGGGLALMAETTSLAGLAEIPIVIINVQRPGPATGLPTRQGQGDLKFTTNIGHGDFPRIIIAPGDAEECFYETFKAFNLAEKYQLPVFIISDKHLASSTITTKKFDTTNMKINRGWMLTDQECEQWTEFKRYLITQNGISPRVIPGQKFRFRSSSDEHDEYGNVTECPKNRVQQEDKRFRKIGTLLNEIPTPKIYGEKKADITMISWGSTKNSVIEAMNYLKTEGLKVNVLHFTYIYPMHTSYVKEILNSGQKIITIEENKTGQFAGILKEHTGIKPDHMILKYNGRAFYPSEIYDEVKRWLQ